MGTRTLPAGTVTFLFTDVEGSTKLLDALGSDRYADALAAHRRIVRDAFARHDGVEVDTQGDAFFFAFPTAPRALSAAREACDALTDGPIRVRMGLHTGAPLLTDEGYVGPDVHKGARIAAVGHGGQILVSAATAALLADAKLRDLGIHRLKDLSAPERLFQADADDHPPLTSLHQANLPVPATPLLGRSHELDELAALLARDDVRLVTLTGPGGIGKTRLALAAAAGVRFAYRDGVAFVDLSSVREPDLLPSAIAASLLLRPAPGEDAAVAVAQGVRDREVLLVLDNLEQLLPAAANVVARLLDASPVLRILATSQAPLRLRSEHEFAVPGLASSAPDGASTGPPAAVGLFVERARAIGVEIGTDANLPVIASICERLDGLPLAIELAAARLRVFGLAELHRRLAQRLTLLADGARDRPERQRTLRAAIEWSEELLDPSGRRILATLGVFAGPFTLDAVEEVVDASARASVVDGVAALLEHSLLRVVDADEVPRRYSMLETVREFAIERFESGGDAGAVRMRHARHFADLAVRLAPKLRTAERRTARATLEASYADCRAALDVLIMGDDRPLTTSLFTALVDVWAEFHRWSEGAAYASAIAANFDGSTAEIARAIHAAGTMAWTVGDIEEAKSRWTRGLEIHRHLGDRAGVARSLNNLAMITSDPREAIGLFRESHELQAAAGDLTDASVLINIGAFSIVLGDFEEARRVATQARSVATRAGDASRIAASIRTLGWLSFVLGDLEESEKHQREGLALAEASDMKAEQSVALANLGWIGVRRDQPEALAMLRDALTLANSQEWASFPLQSIIPAVLELSVRRGDTTSVARLKDALVGVLARNPTEPRGPQLLAMAGITAEDAATRGSLVTDEDAIAAARDALSDPISTPTGVTATQCPFFASRQLQPPNRAPIWPRLPARAPRPSPARGRGPRRALSTLQTKPPLSRQAGPAY